MNILNKLIMLFINRNELESLLAAESKRLMEEVKIEELREIEANKHRLKLCKKHRQESRHAEYSTGNCCHCKLEAHTEELEEDLNKVDLHDAQMAEYDKQLMENSNE